MYTISPALTTSKTNRLLLDEETGLDVITPLINIYKDKKISIAANLAAFCVFTSKKYNIPTDQFISTLARVNLKFSDYVKEIQKYLILI